MDFIIDFGKDVVVDDSAFSRLAFTEKEQFLKTMSDKNLVFVESFYKAKNLTSIRQDAMTGTGGDSVKMRVAMVVGRTLTETEAALIENLQKSVSDFNELLASNRPSYPFATIPGDESIEQFVWNKNSVKRGRNGYSISFKELARLWAAISPYWAGVGDKPGFLRAESVQGYTQEVEVRPDRIKMGCQHLERWEFEQIALKMHFAFPEETKAE